MKMRVIQIKNDHGWPRITTGCGADRSITIRNYRLKNSWVQSISANLTFFTVKQTLLHSRMWHIQVKVTVNLNFECGAITFRGWLWIPSHSQNSWFWIASCIFKVIFSQQSDILWQSDIFYSSAEILQKVQVMHSGCKQCTVGASNATHSGRKQCNAQWAQAMQRTVAQVWKGWVTKIP